MKEYPLQYASTDKNKKKKTHYNNFATAESLTSYPTHELVFTDCVARAWHLVLPFSQVTPIHSLNSIQFVLNIILSI